ncbi:MAG: CxxC-x17-CxxC domain-containing protein, partial [bacterium]
CMNNNPDITIFAETNFRNQKRRFGIKRDDRRRHMYLIGKTGMGKSTMLENMIVDDIRSGKGVAVVDPHGDLVEKVMNYIPSKRINDVINFDPSDMDYPIAFNPLETIDPRYKHLICSGLISVFKKLWADSWGPRLEYLLRNAILALLDTSGTTLLGIMRLLVDKGYRKKIITNIKDPVVKAFWVEEYSKYPDKFQVEAISPIQNKVGQFLSNFLIRNIVGQVKSSFDMREVMDNEKILLVNLSKGRIGEDTSGLLGSMMITKIQLAAMDRINIPEEKRKDFYLYVDEFQNFATDSFATILSEARKYHLNLIMAHQYIEQLNEVVRPAVFGNVGTMVLFRIGAADAEELVKEFTPKFVEEDLVNIPKWECYMKLMVDGIATDPFSANGLPPLKTDEITNNKEKVINLSRERYAEKREIIEEKIMRWSGTDIENLHAQAANNKELKIDEESDYNRKNNFEINKSRNLEIKRDDKNIIDGYDVICSACGKETRVNFKPDNTRSVFCKECLKKFKRGELDMQKINESIDRKKKLERENSKQELRTQPAKICDMKKKEEEKKIYNNSARDEKCAENKKIDLGAILSKRNINEADKFGSGKNVIDSVSLFSALKKGAVDFKGKRIENSVIDIDKEEKCDKKEEYIFPKRNSEKVEQGKKLNKGQIVKL